MPENTGVDHRSVYLAPDIAARANMGLYRSVRELIGQYTLTGHVLDVGCSDGIATVGLEDMTVYGLDLNVSALQTAKTNNLGYMAVCGDIKQLPLFGDALGKIDTVLALDILEHESLPDTTTFLRMLRGSLNSHHTIIASIPVISPFTLDSWREGLLAVRKKERPETGLFDRTHMILRGQRAHRRLFRDSGYAVVDEYQTNHLTDVSGTWKWQQEPNAKEYEVDEWLSNVTDSSRARVPTEIAYHLLKKVYDTAHEGKHPLRRKIVDTVSAYQGIYVLQPAAKKVALR